MFVALILSVPLFDTERLHCRRWRPEDLAALERVYGDADAMRWAGDGRGITPAECEAWRRVTAMAGSVRAGQLAKAGRLTAGSSPIGEMVSSVM